MIYYSGTLAAAAASKSMGLGGDLGRLPEAAQRALRRRIVAGDVRPSEVARDVETASSWLFDECPRPISTANPRDASRGGL